MRSKTKSYSALSEISPQRIFECLIFNANIDTFDHFLKYHINQVDVHKTVDGKQPLEHLIHLNTLDKSITYGPHINALLKYGASSNQTLTEETGRVKSVFDTPSSLYLICGTLRKRLIRETAPDILELPCRGTNTSHLFSVANDMIRGNDSQFDKSFNFMKDLLDAGVNIERPYFPIEDYTRRQSRHGVTFAEFLTDRFKSHNNFHRFQRLYNLCAHYPTAYRSARIFKTAYRFGLNKKIYDNFMRTSTYLWPRFKVKHRLFRGKWPRSSGKTR